MPIMNIRPILELLITKQNLSSEEMKSVMHACMEGMISDIQLAAFLALMRAKGETVEELTIAARILLDFCEPIRLGDDLLDIVGTGGDGKNTFNISTACSIVCAAAGARVAKHGNYSVSSQSGSIDLLTAANISTTLEPAQIKQCLDKTNVCFLPAHRFHPALKSARSVRQNLAIRSFFNLLGPLINPANVKKQVVGVFASCWQEPLLNVLVNMGSTHALVICSEDGMDEVSIAAPTRVMEYHHGQIKHWQISPNDYGCYHADLGAILVNSPVESLELIKQVFAGVRGAAFDIVLLNSGLALYCADLAIDLAHGVQLAQDAILNGRAQHCFEQLTQFK